MSDVIAIVGPTASGKTELADELAHRLHSEVISADAMQVSRGMDIGTAKALPGECKAPLRLVDVVDASVDYSVALYQRDARREIDRVRAEGKIPVLCGGSGLYVRAALDEMDFPAGEVASPQRATYERLAEQIGDEGLHRLLQERDPDSAAAIHPHNVRRVIRALEMNDQGVSYAEQKSGFSHPQEHYRSSYYGLTMDRALLYARIDHRVDLMMERGLLYEVRNLVDAGLSGTLTARQAIGYKELIDYLEGRCTLDEAVDTIKTRSRRYAKRQLSWFRRDERVVWIERDRTDLEAAVSFILDREGFH